MTADDRLPERMQRELDATFQQLRREEEREAAERRYRAVGWLVLLGFAGTAVIASSRWDAAVGALVALLITVIGLIAWGLNRKDHRS